ncbi:MAG: peptidoglycan recognition family protein, partial [Pyrinomonadaceae bacterium]
SITPAGIVVHHSAVPLDYVGGQINADSLDKLHALRGYGIFYWGRTYHIGYHYVILPDGTIQQGRPERCRGAHARGHNSYLGICLVGDFSQTNNASGHNGPETPTREQMRALVELIRQLQHRYHLSLNDTVRHRDVDPGTECPGDRFPFDQLQKEVQIAP